MTQQQIQQLFQLQYNQSNWKQFLSQVFVNARLLATPEILTGINTDVATEAVRLGYIGLNENGIDRNIAVYDVTLAKGIVLERNRVGLRNLLRKYWKDIDAAFIVYHRPDASTGSAHNWRFTYVSELTGFDAEGELIKVKTEPKRYTYILGKGESCRTAAERFEIIARKGSETTLDDVKDAFSVEKLSKSFFEEYKKYYKDFCDFMLAKPNIRQTIFNGDEKAIRDFNKKLLGRIVFLYFIQKKGWMGVPEKSEWGKGDPDFLWNLFSNSRNKEIFYSEYLSKLFFDTLNTQRTDDVIEFVPGEKIRIPYLNGGLFEEDNKRYRNLIFPADMFENLFGFFKQYNFTIYEDDPNDHTVAVDPEMLGHIFENLLEDNKDKGAYYTPKEIVHYMCQESLIEYLTTWFENKGYEITGYIGFDKPEQPAIFSVNEGREGQAILEVPVENKSNKIDRFLIEKMLKKQLEDADKAMLLEHSSEFHNALDSVKICDPAIGSGAFPMGLLKEIFAIKQTLYTFEHGNPEGFDASTVKLNIIQNSIYGVDIEKGAVDIARLRFWLSLVVDDEEPKPLPNLDYKIVVGNSLVSKLGDDIIDIDWDIEHGQNKGVAFVDKMKSYFSELHTKQEQFFKAPDKSNLKNEIRGIKIEILLKQLLSNRELFAKGNLIQHDMGFGLTSKEKKKHVEIKSLLKDFDYQINFLKKLKSNPEQPLQFFDWKLDFSEVMNKQIAEKEGFDIVIGNPPYVEHKKLKYIAYLLKPQYQVYTGSSDLSVYFFEKGFNLLKDNGTFCFINTNKFFNTGYGKMLRKFLLERKIVSMVNFEQVEVFEGILVSSVIFLAKNNLCKSNSIFNYTEFCKERNWKDKFAQEIQKRKVEFDQFLFDEREWTFEKGVAVEIKNKIERLGTPLKNTNGIEIKRGVTTGYDPAFIIPLNEKDKFKLTGVLNSLLKGREIKRYSPLNKNSYLLFIPWHFPLHKDNTISGASKIAEVALRNNFPELYNHLQSHYDGLVKRNKSETGIRYEWYCLQRCAASYYDLFDEVKIVWPLTADKWGFTLDKKGHYLTSGGFLLVSTEVSIKFILAFLNSKLMEYYFKFIGVMTAGGAYTLKKATIEQFPIVMSGNISPFISLVDQILTLKSEEKDTTVLEHQIDLMVYKLYDLTYDECKIVDQEIEKMISREDYVRMGVEEFGEFEIKQ